MFSSSIASFARASRLSTTHYRFFAPLRLGHCRLRLLIARQTLGLNPSEHVSSVPTQLRFMYLNPPAVRLRCSSVSQSCIQTSTSIPAPMDIVRNITQTLLHQIPAASRRRVSRVHTTVSTTASLISSLNMEHHSLPSILQLSLPNFLLHFHRYHQPQHPHTS